MTERNGYILGSTIILALIGFLLWSILQWVFLGMGVLLVLGFGWRLWKVVHRGRMEARRERAAALKEEGEARQQQAIADRLEAEAAQARQLITAIPAQYIGVRLAHPDERALYHVWPHPSTVNQYGLDAPIIDADPAPLATVHFRDIAHQIGAGQMLIGVREDGSLRLGTWDDHKTILVLGKSGSGKTVTIAEKASEAVKGGACLVVCDPHAHKADSLAQKLAPLAPFLWHGTEMVQRHEDILSYIRLVGHELERRVADAPCTPSIVLIVEELNRLMRDERLAEEVSTIIQQIGQEGRGFGVYAVFGAQDMIGPALAKLRRSFISYIVHRTEQAQAGLIIPARYARLAPELPAGQTFVMDDDGMTEPLRQALITRADLEDLAVRLPREPRAPQSALSAILKPGRTAAGALLKADAAGAQELLAALLRGESSPLAFSSPAETPFSAPAPEKIVPFPEKRREEKKKARVTEEERAAIIAWHEAGYAASAIASKMGKSSNFYYVIKDVLEEAAQQEQDA